MLTISCYQGNANKNHMISINTAMRMFCTKRLETESFCECVAEKETGIPLFGRNVN